MFRLFKFRRNIELVDYQRKLKLCCRLRLHDHKSKSRTPDGPAFVSTKTEIKMLPFQLLLQSRFSVGSLRLEAKSSYVYNADPA